METKALEKRTDASRMKALKQTCDTIFDAAYQGTQYFYLQDGSNLHFQLVFAGKVAKLEAFLKAGAPINGYDEEGLTPLMNAALQGHMDCVVLLCKYGCDIHLVDQQKQTCLHKASYHPGKAAIVAFLLERGCCFTLRTT